MLCKAPSEISISLLMPDDTFSEGDLCSLNLQVSNPGAEQEVDLYLLLDVFGDFWSYPSWQHISAGLDHQAVTVPAGESTLELIPQFAMPAVSPAGPLYFYAAMFVPGTLSLETLVSNGAVIEFFLE